MADFPICVPVTQVTRLYEGLAKARASGLMYGVREYLNLPGSGLPGGKTLLASAHSTGVLGGGACTIFDAVSMTFRNEFNESLGRSRSNVSALLE